MNEVIQTITEKVKLLKNTTKIEELKKGYSPDKKYIFYCNDEKLLVQIGDIEGYEKKKQEFQILKEMQQLNVQAPQPIDIGVITERDYCYNIYSYIDGEDAKEVMDTLSEDEQFIIGLDAGTQLTRMHQYKAPSTIETWYSRAMQKHYRYLDAYKSSGIKIKDENKIIDFIENNKHYIKNRPNHFQHDDFHLENIIVKDKQYAGVIDFNNYDWGDPLHDFVKLALFQREISVPFSIGQIEGYFKNNVPTDFWKVYCIYVGMVIFSSIIWSLRYAPTLLDEMLARLNNVIDDHKCFELLKPQWYE